MRDRRVMVFRKSLEELVESLDATVRLAQDVFTGNAADVRKVTLLTDAMRRLESAYVAYRKKLDSPIAGSDGNVARDELARTIEQVRAETLAE
jgi:hypothetical protein